MNVSLLRPPDSPSQSPTHAGAPNEFDLGLSSIIRALDIDGRNSRFIGDVIAELTPHPDTIRYRQDVLDDLLRLPELAARLHTLLPHLRDLGDFGAGQRWGDSTPLLQVGSRLAELENYVRCVEELGTALDEVAETLRSAGLQALRDMLRVIRADHEYAQLAAELPDLRASIDQAGSITLGINLSPQLTPESATIVSINPGRFAGKGTLLDRLLGDRAAADAVRGITALYKADAGKPHTPEHELFRDMNRLLERVAGPVAASVERYRCVQASGLAAVAPELAFFVGAARLIDELQAAGLAMCRPEIAPQEARICSINANYSLDLALRLRYSGPDTWAQAVVTNNVCLDHDASICILTGPNSGGKTTYIRAVGQAQALFQAGLYIPGRSARMSSVKGIFTHFAAAERLDVGGGRLAEELERMQRMFAAACPNSLILLNEPFASTDHIAARAIARDLLQGLSLLNARTIFVTHLHELVEDALTAQHGVVSMVAVAAPQSNNGHDQLVPTYKIQRGLPQVVGYATELARRYGLSGDQLEKSLRERGIVRA
jgi:hypothetical protein